MPCQLSAVRLRERRIQRGEHYSRMLPIEYEPTPAYFAAYEDALARLADAVRRPDGDPVTDDLADDGAAQRKALVDGLDAAVTEPAAIPATDPGPVGTFSA